MPPAGLSACCCPSLTNRCLQEVIRGIETVTDAAGYQTMLAHYGYQAEKIALVSLLSYNIDGLIRPTHHPRTLKMLATAGSGG